MLLRRRTATGVVECCRLGFRFSEPDSVPLLGADGFKRPTLMRTDEDLRVSLITPPDRDARWALKAANFSAMLIREPGVDPSDTCILPTSHGLLSAKLVVK